MRKIGAWIVVVGGLFISPITVMGEEVEPVIMEEMEQVTAPPAQQETDFYRAEVIEIIEEGEYTGFGGVQYFQFLNVQFLEGPDEGVAIELEYTNSYFTEEHRVEEGETVVIIASSFNGDVIYNVFEPYRIPGLMAMASLFIFALFLVAGKKGLTSLIGLGVSLLIILKWMVPQILMGSSPLTVCWMGGIMIIFISLYLAHGFNKRTSLALVSTLITFHLALGFGYLAVNGARLFGMGSEEALLLTYTDLGVGIDLRGLLLGAIVIGALGVLDDITTAQTATVEEIHKADKKLSVKELYKRGLSVGHEHIASLVNTLVLAYVGVAFPVLLLLMDTNEPFWVILNNEFMAEEVGRTLVGSLTLVLAVPIATGLAAHVYGQKK
jgi:uncharacterized membrane protein